MNNLFKQLISLVLPPRCIKCGEVLSDDDGLCADCFNEMNFISQPYCQKCGNPFVSETIGKRLLCAKCLKDNNKPFRLSRSFLEYNDASKKTLLAFKFMDKTENAKVFAKWLNLAAVDIVKDGVDVLMPVPLHYSRLLKRRYNQSALLVKELSKISKIEADYRSIVRHKNTRPQVEFSGRARVKNVKDAFSIKNPANIKGRRILLVDDVMTTGSTLKECAKALLKAGAKSVDTLTIARVVK